MHKEDYKEIVGFKLNNQQLEAVDLLSEFVKKNNANDVFILRGSAGTGKTSLIKIITKQILNSKDTCLKICTPTHRASSIISKKTNYVVKTIHGEIYIPNKLDCGGVEMIKKDNAINKYSVFIIDESSMISNRLNKSENFVVDKPLLEELIDYVKQGNPKNKLIFIGDRFQLPPINESFSPALNKEFLEKKFTLKTIEFELTDVMRQASESKVLSLATDVRNQMIDNKYQCYVNIDKYYSGVALNEYIKKYNPDKIDSVIMICGANKNVDTWNNIIRKKLGFNDKYLNVGEYIVVQDNWLDKMGNTVLKGEFGKVTSIGKKTKYANLNFVDVELDFSTHDRERKFSTKILLESIHTRYGRLDVKLENNLYASVKKHNAKYRISERKSDDVYLGSMRVRHGYAITCHKSQGGEWDNVFIHPWRIGNDLPWTYTALTRARNYVFSYAA